ncbi:malonyl CoA-ACP transacylase [Paenibacillus riograndensis]|nr:malonyl CoA-ACP transacylase [Paenibacillus riograndensis]
MTRPTIFLFSGQGSHYRHMGESLFKKNEIFQRSMLEMDSIVETMTGFSVVDKLYNRDYNSEPFERLLETHPSIFMVEHALQYTLRQNGIIPDVVVGASMGEYAAAVSAGVMNRDDALATLVTMAQLTESFCGNGQMLAVFTHSSFFYEEWNIFADSELAAVHFDAHFVVTGEGLTIERIKMHLDSRRILYQLLPVNYSFHSRRMDIIQQNFLSFLKKIPLHNANSLFYSCECGGELPVITPEHFWDAVRKPIQFEKTIKALEAKYSCNYIDAGPGGTLAGFVNKLISPPSLSVCHRIMTPFHHDDLQLDKILNKQRQEIQKTMLAYIFPGQGAQKIGMGAELFDLFPEKVASADRILGYSIRTLCLEDPARQLNQTEYTQPALYVINALHYEKTIRETGRYPDVVAGHSLGEYNSLLAAGVFDFETGLQLVQKRGELMSRMMGGGMTAIVGLTEEQVHDILHNHNLGSIDIANLNAPTQIVLAGPKQDMELVQQLFEKANAELVLPLRVSGAFHSRYMSEARTEFEIFLASKTLSEPQIPVISNVTARYYNSGEIKNLLGEQLTNPVKWTESVRVLLGMNDPQIIEIGPSQVLTKLVEKIKLEAAPIVLDKKPLLIYTSDHKKSYNNDNSSNSGISEKKTKRMIQAEALGDPSFLKEYGVKLAYITGSMYKGISSEQMIVKLGKSGLLGFFGSGGLGLERIEQAIQYIQNELRSGESFGMNIVHNTSNWLFEEDTVNLYIKYGIRFMEASAFMSITPALILYRAKGLRRLENEEVMIPRKLIAKVSRPEVAEAFMRPAPEQLVGKLLAEEKLSQEEAALLRNLPMADDICVEADSGGHTDHAVALTLFPSIQRLRDDLMNEYSYSKKIRIGAAGGIGSPGAAASMFMMGADFILTGSINQCTVEAGTSDVVKDLLNQMNVQDTDSAPAGDMFEIGAKVQVLKKGLFFPARANKLYDIYRHHDSIEDLDEKLQLQLQNRYFKRSFEEVYQEVKAYHVQEEIEKAEQNPKHKMALIFKWYFAYSTRIAMSGDIEHKVDFQVHCGPALGAFNQWVKGGPFELWRNRHVDEIGIHLMNETAHLLSERLMDLALIKQ